MEHRPPTDLLCADLPTHPLADAGIVLIAGASGYIGGRLVPELAARGYRLRAMVRADAQIYRDRWPGVEVTAADALEPGSLETALQGVETAYYLIHSLMLGRKHFAEADIRAAVHFRCAAAACGVRRIIYLGGLGDSAAALSPHLRSRLEVAHELCRGPVPVTILRAAVIIGSGSASYEIIANLIRRFRIVPLPRWAATRCQPIAIRDVIKYLVGVLEIPAAAGQTYDIGGPDILTYGDMLRIQAGLVGRRILFVPVRFSPIGFYAYVASLFLPVPAPIIRSLLESIRNEVVCRDEAVQRLLPFARVPYKEALVRALSREEQDNIHTRWSDAYPPAYELAIKLRDLPHPPRFHAHYSILSAKSAATLFAAVCRIGGRSGWFHGNWLWRLRGAMDRLLLGIGTVRGRRSGTTLRIHDVIDFWRVEDLQAERRLLLRAEMKLPGMAWLEFCITPENGRHRLSVDAHFHTRTLAGRLYWYFFLPFHAFIFRDLLRGIERSVRPT